MTSLQDSELLLRKKEKTFIRYFAALCRSGLLVVVWFLDILRRSLAQSVSWTSWRVFGTNETVALYRHSNKVNFK